MTAQRKREAVVAKRMWFSFAPPRGRVDLRHAPGVVRRPGSERHGHDDTAVRSTAVVEVEVEILPFAHFVRNA
jgi:hypothetical protein